MQYRLIMWDFDGTLADTMSCSLQVYNQLAVRYGFKTLVDIEKARGMTTATFLKAHNISLLKLPSFIHDFLAGQKEMMPSIKLFPEIPATLRRLRASGCRLGILSSNAKENIVTCLRANGVESEFQFILGYSKLLGKHRTIRKVLKKESLKAGELLYVGDEVRDIEAAREAGVDIAAVAWGYHKAELLAAHQPTYLVASPQQILQESA